MPLTSTHHKSWIGKCTSDPEGSTHPEDSEPDKCSESLLTNKFPSTTVPHTLLFTTSSLLHSHPPSPPSSSVRDDLHTHFLQRGEHYISPSSSSPPSVGPPVDRELVTQICRLEASLGCCSGTVWGDLSEGLNVVKTHTSSTSLIINPIQHLGLPHRLTNRIGMQPSIRIR